MRDAKVKLHDAATHDATTKNVNVSKLKPAPYLQCQPINQFDLV